MADRPRYAFSTKEKLLAVAAEVRRRRMFYRKEIADGNASQEDADREIAIMESIQVDLRKRLVTEGGFL